MGQYTDELLSGPATPQVAPPPVARSATEELLSPSPPPSVPTTGIEPPRYQPDKAMGMGLQGVGSLATDPKARIRWYAEQSGMPEDRFSVGKDGRIAYQADDGKSYYAEAPSRLPRSFGEAGQQAMRGLGPAIPAVTGTTAGVLTAPMLAGGPLGMAGSMGLTGLAGAGGEALRQGIANQVMGQDFSPKQMAIEGGQAALGQGIGGGLTRLANRNAAVDINRYDKNAVANLRAKAQTHGVDLTPAESTGLPSLAARQKALGNLPASADTMQEFYEKRAGQVGDAVNRTLRGISPEDSAEAAGKQGVEAAAKAIKNARAERAAVAGPKYAFVNDPAVRVPQAAFQPIADDKFLADQIKAVKGSTLNDMASVADDALPVLDQVKKNIDDMISVAKRAGEGNKVRLLQGKLDKLLGAVDEQFPAYKEARAAFAGESPAVDALEKGIVGIVSKLKDPQAKEAATRLFNPTSSGPRAAQVARDAIEKADPAAWQAIKRAYLEDAWSKAQTQTLQGEALNAGAKFRKALFGDLKQTAILKQVLSPDEFRGLSDLSDVLQAAGRVKPIGSDTAWNEAMKAEMKAEMKPWQAKVIDAFRLPSMAKRASEWFTERAMREGSADMAKLVTSPDAMTKLRELRQLSPTSVKFRVGLGHFLVRFGGLGAEVVENELAPESTGSPQ